MVGGGVDGGAGRRGCAGIGVWRCGCVDRDCQGREEKGKGRTSQREATKRDMDLPSGNSLPIAGLTDDSA